MNGAIHPFGKSPRELDETTAPPMRDTDELLPSLSHPDFPTAQLRRYEVETEFHEAQIDDFETGSRTALVERYFFMILVAVGTIASIVLAFLTAGQAEWQYHLAPVTGLVIAGGGAVKLRLISRDRSSEEKEGS